MSWGGTGYKVARQPSNASVVLRRLPSWLGKPSLQLLILLVLIHCEIAQLLPASPATRAYQDQDVPEVLDLQAQVIRWTVARSE